MFYGISLTVGVILLVISLLIFKESLEFIKKATEQLERS